MKVRMYFEYDYRELEELIAAFYSWKEYEFVAAEELQNDVSWTAEVDKEPLDEFEKEDLAEIKAKNGNKCWRTRLLLKDMCNQGAIPEGHYLVEVSW